MISHARYRLVLCGLFLLVWGLLAISPVDRHDWALENILAVLFAVALAASFRYLPLSRISYTLIFVYLCLHSLGAHYTYSNVPYNDWFAALFGTPLDDLMGWRRNHYDRLVHFGYGLLLAYPIRELFLRIADVRGFWGYFLPLDVTMSTSMLFELLEWAVVEIVASDLGATYLGLQGDQWDFHKDMGLATLGALIAMLLTMLINSRLQNDFAREWVDSLRIKHADPLGEDEIVRLMDNTEHKNG